MTYILAARYEIARLAAQEKGLSMKDWRYICTYTHSLGVQPSKEVKLIRVWSPGIPLNDEQHEVLEQWEQRKFPVEIVQT